MAVDIGFICFNRPNYPNFTALLKHLDVPTVWTDMASPSRTRTVMNGLRIRWGLFAWKRNALDKKFRGMIGEIIDFNNVARAQLTRTASRT